MNFAITEPNELNADLLAVQDATCADTQDGSIDLDVSGGNGSYYYKWNDPKIPNIKNPYLSQGNYQLEVSDLNGCRDSVFVIIESPDSLSLFKSTYLNDTSNTCEGELTVDARGGIGPYMYFSGGELNVFDNVFDNLCKGLIDITVEDANGCELTKTYEIKSPEISETINSSTDLLSDFTFYPNPSDVFVTAEFSLPAPQNISISILDAGGKLIQIINVSKSQSDVYKIVLNTSQFSNGNYYLNVNTNQGISSKQFQVYH
jgi:hypothetical protein